MVSYVPFHLSLDTLFSHFHTALPVKSTVNSTGTRAKREPEPNSSPYDRISNLLFFSEADPLGKKIIKSHML